MNMQKVSTLQFWDDFYRKQQEENCFGTTKEWVLQPSLPLLQCIVDLLPRTNHSTCNVLEIGCGTSSLAADLCEFWTRHHQRNSTTRFLHVMATDVSPVCIEQQQRRLQQCRESIIKETVIATLKYKAVDVTEKHTELNGKFDMIVDKGCLDICMFRSRKGRSVARYCLEKGPVHG